jgi:hypothetical protein
MFIKWLVCPDGDKFALFWGWLGADFYATLLLYTLMWVEIIWLWITSFVDIYMIDIQTKTQKNLN